MADGGACPGIDQRACAKWFVEWHVECDGRAASQAFAVHDAAWPLAVDAAPDQPDRAAVGGLQYHPLGDVDMRGVAVATGLKEQPHDRVSRGVGVECVDLDGCRNQLQWFGPFDC